jgi:hypothetical protein
VGPHGFFEGKGRQASPRAVPKHVLKNLRFVPAAYGKKSPPKRASSRSISGIAQADRGRVSERGEHTPRDPGLHTKHVGICSRHLKKCPLSAGKFVRGTGGIALRQVTKGRETTRCTIPGGHT